MSSGGEIIGPNMIKDQRGMIAVQILCIYVVFFFVAIALTLALAQGAKIKAAETYYNFQQALDFAVSEIATGNVNDVRVEQSRVTRVFMLKFAHMLNATPHGSRLTPNDASYPGPIDVVSIKGIQKGESIPGGQARQAGFYAQINVPVLRCNVPLIGEKYVTVPLRYFSVVQPIRIGST